ncbi:MAG: phage tail terminator-like protein [Sneathiellales bacterium]|nr:phage tail terminator-like protein [Sneathiellales bacterium]
MSYQKIQAALDTHLQAYSGADLIFPSTLYMPRHGREFVAAEFIPGTVKTVFLGAESEKEHRGLYKLWVRSPSFQSALRLVDQLRAHFLPGQSLIFDGLKVFTETSEVEKGKGSLKFTNFPLVIQWRSYFKEA